MKTMKQLLEERDALHVRAVAIAELAKNENRELVAEEQSEIDAIISDNGKLAVLDKEISRAEKLEAIQKDLVKARVATQGVKPVVDDTVIRVPAKAKRHGKLVAYKSEEDAYAMGQWLAATVYGNQNSAQWCRDHGIQNAMTTGDNTKGGFLVPDPLEASLVELREQFGVFRRHAQVVPMANGVINQPKRLSGTTVYYIGEDPSGNGITASDMALGNVRLEAKTAGILTAVSNNLNEDAVISLAETLTRDMAAAFAEAEDNAGFNGNGTATYGGIVGAANVLAAGSIADAVSGNTSFGTLDMADFELAIAKLKMYAGIMPAWFIHSSGYAASMLRLLDAAGGNTNATLSNGVSGATFLGYPVVFSQVLNSTLTTQTSTIVAYFGDLRLAAMFGDTKGVEISSDSSLYFKQNALAIRGIQRYDINVHDRGTASTGGALIAVKTAAS